MQKIISLFHRNYETDRLVRNEVVPGAEWVAAGEGVATRKWNGSACAIDCGVFYKRYDLPLIDEWKRKKKKGYAGPWDVSMYVEKPFAWRRAQDDPDETSGHWPGWLPVGEGPEDKWFRAALVNTYGGKTPPEDLTYEAVGPHFQGNAECREIDLLEPHGECELENFPRDFDGIREFFVNRVTPNLEGVVWHHPDGRMVKIKVKDFGLR